MKVDEKETSQNFERDMYKPIKSFFEKVGFNVKSEIRDCDVMAEKDGRIVVIEMKKNLNIKLLMQGTLRQRISDEVYLAVPKPKKSVFSKEWNDKKYLLKRLNLGLLFVKDNRVEVALEPKEFDMVLSQKRNRKKRRALVDEFNSRSGDYNIGGMNRGKIVTAYREEALKIAYILRDGEKSIKELKEQGASPKASSILQKNFYNWFVRIQRGIYTLTKEGESALLEYEYVINEIFHKEI